jgi:hypothetical protein
MPKVGDKHFPYDPAGMSAAREYSAKVGIPVERTKSYNTGGLIRSLPSKITRVKPRGVGIARKGFLGKGTV